MAGKRVILANSSRLLREMLNRILLKTNSLEVVREINDYEKLPSAINQSDAEWVIMSLPADRCLPDWVDTCLSHHPQVHFLAVSGDGSQVKTKWLENHEEDIFDLSLGDLIRIIENDSISFYASREVNI